MKNRKLQLTEYVRKVNERTMQFAQGLLSEHEKLSNMAASLEREREALQGRISEAEQELMTHQTARKTLEEQCAEIRFNTDRFTSEYERLEQQNFNLLNLYVASFRLHATLDRSKVLQTIQEIISNLVGCEEIAIYENARQPRRLALLHTFSVTQEIALETMKNDAALQDVVRRGEIYVSDEPITTESAPEAGKLTACIPLKAENEIIGAVALYRLLPQKVSLEAVDHELFGLLSAHAGMALYCTSLHAAAASPRTVAAT